MVFGEVLKPHNGISALPGRMRESLGSGEGEPGRGDGQRKGEQKSSTGQMSGGDHG